MKHLECALAKNNQFWKYIVVLVLSYIIANIVGAIPIIGIMISKLISKEIDPTAMMENSSNLNALGISSNAMLFLMLLVFAVMLLALVLLIKAFHQRSIKEVINGTNKIRWNRFSTGAGIWLVLSIISLAISYVLSPENFVLQLDLSSFIPLLIIVLVMIPIQTSCEEITFRGYLAQGIGNLTKNRWMVLIIPSVLFGLMHAINPEVKEFGFFVMMPQYILIGALFALISILDDGIELAMGMHAANNAFAALFITHSSSVFQTAAIFEVKEVNPYYSFIELIVFSAVVLALLYKKYNWNFSILNKKIEAEEINETI